MSKLIQRFATVTLADGSKKRISARGKTEREALRKLDKMVVEYQAGIRTINNNTKFSIWYEEWADIYKKPVVQNSTYKQIVSRIKNDYVKMLGNMPISSIKTIHLQKCLNELSGFSQDRIRKSYNNICEVFKKAEINGLINHNPCIGLEMPKGKVAQTRRALTTQEREYFLLAIANHEKGLMFAMTYACGLRPAEVRALQWKNLDLKNGIVKVRQAIESGTKNIKLPKSNAGLRDIPIPDWFLEMLRKLPVAIDKNAFVFFNSKSPMTSQRYLRSWNSLMREIDIIAGSKLYRNAVIEHAVDQTLTPYYLRHTYCTILCENNVPLKTAQYLMGHSTIEMTANIYTHVTTELLEQARQQINGNKSVAGVLQ